MQPPILCSNCILRLMIKGMRGSRSASWITLATMDFRAAGRSAIRAHRSRGERVKMAKQVVYIVVALIVVGFFYLGYTSYDASRSFEWRGVFE